MSSKKIGIITFHRVLNYGAILQTYALVVAIKKLGYESEIIDYRNKLLEKNNTLKRFIHTNNIFRAIFQYIEFPFWVIRKIKFKNFIKMLPCSEKVVEIDEEIEKKYFRLFVGSDQVWNYKITNFDKNYFLYKISDRTKKNSYAASFGLTNIPKEYCAEYKMLLDCFENISVREKEGATIINKLINVNPSIVLDPSLLLSKEEWGKILKNKYKNQEYILIYQLAYSETLIAFAQKLSKETGYKIITINGNPRQLIRANYILTAGPKDWLGLINNAKYIVTNSFHGIAFSINFNKIFFVDLLDSKLDLNCRINNILEIFNLKDRVIGDRTHYKQFKTINYNIINEKLKQERKRSIKYLKNSLDIYKV